MAVQAAEASCGLRLVDRRVVGDRWITLGDFEGVRSQLLWEGWIEKMGVRWAAAMMNETDDGMQRVVLDGIDHAVGFLPMAELIEELPLQRDAQGFQAEGCEELQVCVDACAMAGVCVLIEEGVAHAIDGALGTAPKLHAGWMIRQEASP